jgi:hypothetical protein
MGIHHHDGCTMHLLRHPHTLSRMLAIPHRTKMLYPRLPIEEHRLQYAAPFIFCLYHIYSLFFGKDTAFF